MYSKKFLIFGSLGSFLLILALGFTFYVIQQKQKPINSIPANIHSTYNYKIYYPSKLPKGCKLDKTSFSQTNEVLIYVAKCGQSTISFSIQVKPQDISISDLYIRLMKDPADVVVNIGKAKVGELENKASASIIADNTWIIIRDNGSNDRLRVESIVRGMVALNR